MNTAAHLHLLVNHLPIIGAMLSLPLLGLALLQPEDRGMLRSAVLILFLSGLGAGAALWTGGPAEADVLSSVSDANDGAIDLHEDRARIATAVSALTAVESLAVLLLIQRRRSLARPLLFGLTVSAALSAGAMAWTGAAGGLIRHTEFLPSPHATPNPGKPGPGEVR